MRREADRFGEWQPEHTLSMSSRPGPGGKRDAQAAFGDTATVAASETVAAGGVGSPGKRPSRTEETGFDPESEYAITTSLRSGAPMRPPPVATMATYWFSCASA